MAEARLLSDLGPLGLLVREQPTLRLALEACRPLWQAVERWAVRYVPGERRRRRASRRS